MDMKKKKLDSVMIVQVYTHHKQYCRHLFPKMALSLTYPNTNIFFVDEKNYPALTRCETGEERAAMGRQIGIERARELDPDWLFFMDLDVEPDPDMIQKLLKVKHPVVGAMHAARGNANHCIGHNYKNRKTMERVWLKRGELHGTPEVDGISGGTLMIARGVYKRVDYTGYMGPFTIPNRYTADDEYLLIKIYESLKIRPKVATDAFSWHYSDDGRAYKLWGKVKQWREF